LRGGATSSTRFIGSVEGRKYYRFSPRRGEESARETKFIGVSVETKTLDARDGTAVGQEISGSREDMSPSSKRERDQAISAWFSSKSI